MKTAQRNNRLRRNLTISMAALSILLTMSFSTSQALKALYAAYTLETEPDITANTLNNQEMLTARRKIQKHFTNTGIYVPMEDIVFTQTKKKDSRLHLLMHKACGPGKIYVWVPLKFKWPIFGERVFEWCWKI